MKGLTRILFIAMAVILLLTPLAACKSQKQEVVVTWNPIVLEIMDQVPGAKDVFNSSKIPHEIQDWMMVRTDVLEKHPELAKALAGAWYETLALMQGEGPEAMRALTEMAKKSGTTIDSYKRQLKTTYMYWKPEAAAEFTRSKKIIEVTDLVRKFSYESGLWQGAKSVDVIGIQFPDGKVLGDDRNVKLRFTDKYMEVPTWRTNSGSKEKFTIAWSIYVGWMPWPYAAESGILKKWADRFNIEIELVQMDYIPSVEAYVAGQVEGVVMTNMEALNMPASAGIDTTGIIIGDYSDGNDAVITVGGLKLSDLKGKEVFLVQGSVSHYLFARGLQLEGQGLKMKDVKLTNASDADIGSTFIAANTKK